MGESNSLNNEWLKVPFEYMAEQISVRVEPAETDLEVYVGLEHLDSESLRIKRHGKPGDVKGVKLHVCAGDIIFGKRRAYQRKVAIADFEGICSAHAMVLRARPENIEPDFLPFFMQSEEFTQRAVAISEGSLSPTIKWKKLAMQEFLIPPIEEQRYIANILSAAEDCIVKNEKLLDEAEKYKKIFMKEIFSRGIDENGRIRSEETHKFRDSALGRVPEEWEVVKLIDCTDIKLSNVDKKIYKNEIPVLLCNYLDVYKNECIRSSLPFMVGSAKRVEIEKFRVFRDDVIITKDSEDKNDIAKPAYVAEEIDSLICGYHLAILRPKDNISGLFLSKALRLPDVNIFFQKRANGITRFGISKHTIETALIPLPPLQEQHQIAEILSKLDDTIQKTQENINKTKTLKMTLLNQLLTKGFDATSQGSENNV